MGILERFGLWLARGYFDWMEKQACEMQHANELSQASLKKAQDELAALQQANALLTEERDKLARLVSELTNDVTHFRRENDRLQKEAEELLVQCLKMAKQKHGINEPKPVQIHIPSSTDAGTKGGK